MAAAGCAIAVVPASAQVKAVNAGSGLLTRGLPDGRAYEQVTPANKDNGDPYIRPGVYAEDRSAVTGNTISFISLYGFPGVKVYGVSYMAARGKHSWVSQEMIPPQSTDFGGLCAALVDMVAYSPDMSKGILADGANQSSGCGTDDPQLVNGEPQGVQNLFLHNNKTGSYQLVSLNPVSGPPADANYDGSSNDLSHVVFDEPAQLTSNAPSGDDLYEWVNGTVTLVTQVPSGATSCTGSACSPALGSLAGGSFADAMHAVSTDGSRIYFTSNGDLYLRQGGTSTTQIDAPASGAPGPGGGGQFAAASADGSKVFFTDADTAGLTSNTVPGSGQNLYEYDVASNTLTDLTPTSDAQVQGFSGESDDASYVYFVADGALASGATSGQPNLYLLHGGTTTFIATLDPSDSCDWNEGCLTARVPSNGKFIAFNSILSLTGFNNKDVTTKQPDDEIYLYEASSNKLACASCSPSGAHPTGSTTVQPPEQAGVSNSQESPQRNVSESGQVFFQSPDALAPAASNGRQDVYEYEPNGTGSCAQAGGCVYLISGGTADADSLFFDASPDGSNVFFVTNQQLVPQDTDGAYDIYDARVDGGFPAPVSPPPPCQGESCKPPPNPPPPLPTVATVTFGGSGNASTNAIKRAVAGTAFRVAVAVPRKGQITVTGAGINTARKSALKAGTYRLRLSLTRRERQQLELWGRLKLSIRVRYVPARGHAATARFKLTVKA